MPDSLYFTSVEVNATNSNIAYVTIAGFSAGNKVFKTTNAIVTPIPVAGYVVLPIEASEVGVAYNVRENTIVKLKSPDANIVAVTNELATAGGADIETDVETRNRWFKIILKVGNSSIEAINSVMIEKFPFDLP